MPILVAFFIRQLLVIGVQLGIFSLIAKFVVPLLNTVLEKIMTAFGVPEETAKDILANEILETAEGLGLTVALSKAKLPLAIAERLGFTSKGFSSRKLSGNTQEKIARQKLAIKGVVATDSVVASEVAGAVAKNRGFPFQTVANFASIAVAFIGIPIGAGLLLINTIDFAAWPTSSYQNTFQKFFSFFGLNPDQDAKNSKVLGEDTWKRIFAIYQNLGAIGIEDPYKEINVPFTRENLIDLVDKVAANMIAERGKATLGWVIGATQGFMVMSAPVTQAKIDKTFSGVAVAPADASKRVSIPQITKVFTGIISQGIVAENLSFVPRPDDLIESVEELKSAAANNLAPFLQALLSKVVYEVKVVSSIVTADGFKQTGTVQKIQNGWDALGKPKYKNVVNKFAVLDIFVFTDRKVRTKISRVVLGPVDSIKLKIGINDLTALSVALPKEITTTKIEEIKGIATDTPIPITTQTPMIQPTPSTSVPDTAPAVSTPTPQALPPAPVDKIGLSATTLFEWYQAHGWSIPTVAIRATLYQNLGLGQANYYTGTAEQNTKLLYALKYTNK